MGDFVVEHPLFVALNHKFILYCLFDLVKQQDGEVDHFVSGSVTDGGDFVVVRAALLRDGNGGGEIL